MRVLISSDEAEETTDLFRWLRADPEVVRHAELTLRPSADPSAMGAWEALDVFLTHATALSGLALAVAAWRQARRAPAPVRLTRADGQTLVIGGDPRVTSDLIVRFLSAGTDADGGEQAAG